MSRTPALVLSSHTIGLCVIRSLGIMGVPVIVGYYNKSDMGYVSRYVKERLYLPHPEEHPEMFVEKVANCGRKLGEGVLIPADDATLKIVSRFKEFLSRYFIVASPEWNIISKIIDKKYTYEVAAEAQIDIPRTFSPRSIDEAVEGGRKLGFPCLVKPRQSHIFFEAFRKKMVLVRNQQELFRASSQALENHMDILIQEHIPGDEKHGFNYNSYFWNGAPLIEFTAKKCLLAHKDFGVPCVVRSQAVPEIIEPGRKILKALRFHGYSCTEFKRDARDGKFKFLEVNGRHNRSGMLAVECGINFPYLEYLHLTTGNLPSRNTIEGDLEEIYWIDEIAHLWRWLSSLRHQKEPLTEWIKPYLARNTFAVSSFSDLKPILKRIIDLVKIGSSRFLMKK